jgi:hypothetical protein
VTILENAYPSLAVVTSVDGSAVWTPDPLVLKGLVGDDTTQARDLVMTWASARDRHPAVRLPGLEGHHRRQRSTVRGSSSHHPGRHR